MVFATLFKREKAPKQPSNQEMDAQFEKWFDSVSIAELRILFLDNLLHGHEAISGLLKAPELSHFDRVTGTLSTTSGGQIASSSILSYLQQAHGAKGGVITSAWPLLESLLLAHAHFPFTEPVPLTRDTLLQAIILLAWKCDNYFRQSTGVNKEDTIRTRPETERVRFAFSALARPPTGAPTRSDVVDVLCRLNYPMGQMTKPKGEPIRRKVREMEPLAERVHPGEDEDLGLVKVEEVRLLVGLVEKFPSRFEEPVKDVGLPAVEGDVMSREQFVKWAKRVRLLDVLHQVFEVFLRER